MTGSAAKKVLITGGTGLLGKGMEETMPAGCRPWCVHHRPYDVIGSRARHLILDVRDPRAVDRLFAKHRFDAVVHAAGIASVDHVERHRAEGRESNLLGTRNIVSACRRSETYLAYISTNAVFDGSNPPYRESDPVCPVNEYGRLKAECERLVAQTLARFSIVRPILMYGWNHGVARPNTVTWVYEKLLRGETVYMVDDVCENPLFNQECGRALWAVLERRAEGVFHVAGKTIVNRYEFALKVARVFGLDKSLIHPVRSSFFPGIAPRPRNTTFSTARMERELGVRPMTLDEGLRAMKRAMGAVLPERPPPP